MPASKSQGEVGGRRFSNEGRCSHHHGQGDGEEGCQGDGEEGSQGGGEEGRQGDGEESDKNYEFIEQTHISIINTDVQIPLLRVLGAGPLSFLTKWWDLLDFSTLPPGKSKSKF